MRSLPLGNTGMLVSEVGFGGIPIIRVPMDEAIRLLRRAYDRGITLYDTASVYLDSEEKMGQAFDGIRQRLVLATKTLKRDRKAAEADLDISLRRLRTDYLDLYQLHQVSQETDYQTIIGPNGVLEAVLRAQEAGKIRHLGVSSHNLEMAVRLVKTNLFSVIQFPFNFIEDAAQEELHPLARERNMGILVMKPFCGSIVDNARIVFKFLRQFPDAIPLPGCESIEQLDEVVDLYETENVVLAEDLAEMDRYRQELGTQFCRRCEYCQPCPQGVRITLIMLYEIMIRRIDPANAEFLVAKAMESALNCIECGECAERCPYNLPIPETIKKHRAMYDRYLAEKK